MCRLSLTTGQSWRGSRMKAPQRLGPLHKTSWLYINCTKALCDKTAYVCYTTFARNTICPETRQTNKNPTKLSANIRPWNLKRKLLHLVAVRRRTASWQLTAAQKRYKQQNNRTGRWKPAIFAGNEGFATRLHLAAPAVEEAKFLQISTWNKLMLAPRVVLTVL